MSQLLEIDSVQFSYGNRKILSDIYLRCAAGKVTGLMGRNGCGKSTLLQILFGSNSISDHSLRIDGQKVQAAYHSKNGVAYLPQFNFIPDNLSIGNAFKYFGVPFAEFAEHFYEMSGRQSERMDRLSGGWRRLVEIYLVLKKPGNFVLLDEPFTHIMPLHMGQIAEWIGEEKKHKGILLSDHLHEVVLPLCDEIYLLKDGKTHLVSGREDLVNLGYLSI